MNFINCDKEYITSRYEFLRDHMKGIPRLNIFRIDDWAEPWGFGRQFKYEVNKIYKEATKIIFDEEVNSISDNELTELIIITLKTDTEVGIVWISEDNSIFKEHMEDLFNAEIISKKSLVSIPASPTPKKLDNLVINRMKLFKNELPTLQ